MQQTIALGKRPHVIVCFSLWSCFNVSSPLWVLCFECLHIHRLQHLGVFGIICLTLKAFLWRRWSIWYYTLLFLLVLVQFYIYLTLYYSVQVLDEADRLLNEDFEKSLNQILEEIPRDRKTYLFSATMTKKVGTPCLTMLWFWYI